MRTVLLPLTLLTACASYAPGSFTSRGKPFAGHRVTTGCLDLAVEVKRELLVDGPVVTYQFGNRCNHAQTVDLLSIAVTGRTADGSEVALTPYDPLGEMKAMPLDGRLIGRERIEYHSTPLGAELVSMCIAVGEIAGPDAPPMPPTCFRISPDQQVAEVLP